jgi:hypothetical protein
MHRQNANSKSSRTTTPNQATQLTAGPKDKPVVVDAKLINDRRSPRQLACCMADFFFERCFVTCFTSGQQDPRERQDTTPFGLELKRLVWVLPSILTTGRRVANNDRWEWQTHMLQKLKNYTFCNSKDRYRRDLPFEMMEDSKLCNSKGIREIYHIEMMVHCLPRCDYVIIVVVIHFPL